MQSIMCVTQALLSNASQEGVVIDWNDVAGRIALSIFCMSSLSLQTKILRSDTACLMESDTLRNALITLNSISSRRLMNPFWALTEKVTGTERRFKRARSEIRAIVHDIVIDRQTRHRLGDSPSDYLDELLKNPDYSDPTLIRDTLVTLLFAGRDNTQNTLAWSMHALLTHEIWIERMRDEAMSLVNDFQTGLPLPYAELSAYHIHLAVFYETVRLWPGLPKNGRQALFDDVLPALPHLNFPAVKVHKGDYIFWSDYYIMRHPQVWGLNASEFDPGRHLDASGHFVRPNAPDFIGFGAGPRLCPAAQLAAYEFVACWSSILPSFHFKARYTAEPKMMETFTPAIDGPMYVEVIMQH
ncbi:hypothetical protein EW146_g7937 [Bondarzewia mesenterica]|uniref:Cytochrome P450 n=1 Tax=Bondarzewia mesenterica TaxID=1095465 RepID=A0A4S4LI93_9AGAM|nr:hypothetical protein EW146_g7937 [Bondarzewia mesenterica]